LFLIYKNIFVLLKKNVRFILSFSGLGVHSPHFGSTSTFFKRKKKKKKKKGKEKRKRTYRIEFGWDKDDWFLTITNQKN
jgi:hypothetical protein